MAVGRAFVMPLLLANFILTLIVVVLSGLILDRMIASMEDALTDYGGNDATVYLVIFSNQAGAASFAAAVVGLHHARVWSTRSGAAAQAAAWISWSLLCVSLFVACEEIYLPGDSRSKLRLLEICTVVLTITQFLYSLALYIGDWTRVNHARSPRHFRG